MFSTMRWIQTAASRSPHSSQREECGRPGAVVGRSMVRENTRPGSVHASLPTILRPPRTLSVRFLIPQIYHRSNPWNSVWINLLSDMKRGYMYNTTLARFLAQHLTDMMPREAGLFSCFLPRGLTASHRRLRWAQPSQRSRRRGPRT